MSSESKLDRFANGFVSASIAEIATISLDTAKVKMQLDPLKLKYTDPVSTIRLLVQEEGFAALFAGLPAGIVRAGTIYAIRLGIYEPALQRVSSFIGRDSSKLDVKIITAMPVTLVSMAAANPFDVLKVRYQKRPHQPHYSIDPRMIRGIIQAEGFWASMYAGFVPNLLRNMTVGSAELVGYFQCKQVLSDAGLKEGLPMHLVSSLFAGACAVAFGSPMDVVATRVMQPDVVKSGVSSFHYTLDMLRREGVQSFYKGVLPNWLRLSGFNVALWLSFEQIKRLRSPPSVVEEKVTIIRSEPTGIKRS